MKKMLFPLILALSLSACVTTSGRSVRYTCASADAALKLLTPRKHSLPQSTQDEITKAAITLKPVCGATVEPTEAQVQDAGIQAAIATLVRLSAGGAE